MSYSRILLLTLGIVLLNLAGCSSKPVAPDSGSQASVTDKSKATARKLDPKASAAFKRALKILQEGNTDEALALFQEMATNYPTLSGSRTNIGLIYLKANDLELAEASFQQALEIKEDNAIAYNNLGVIYRKKGRFTDAEQYYLKAIKTDPDYANAYLNLGILYDLYLRKLDIAIQYYEKHQSLQSEEDKTVKKWILILKRRLKVSK
ncbi:MAG: tetratricopeptide repeat protein [Gammaproteobacteria bacterium]|nr:tetratricopeptide repeat protein [Gammaproteobacteria bacterium]